MTPVPLRPEALDALPPAVRRPDRVAPRDGGIAHIGVGAFHRAHQARYLADLRDVGASTWSITGIGLRAPDRAVAAGLAAQGGLYTVTARDAEAVETSVVDAIDGVLLAQADLMAAHELLAHPSTAVVTLTITEGGYLVDDAGAFDPARRDAAIAAGGSAFDLLVDGLALRRARGHGPVTVLSCDNLVANGRAARASLVGTAELLAPDLAGWIADAVAFPDSMVDRITPATTDADRAWLAAEIGVDDAVPVVCEPFRQWVVEDAFAGPRPPWEAVGVELVADVGGHERRKLQLLNAAHSALGYAGALRGHADVAEAARDDIVLALLVRLAVDEAVPAVEAATGLPAAAYAAEVRQRFRNRAVGDQIARLCTDGSAKLPAFLLPTVRATLAAGRAPNASALVLACWARYLASRGDGDRVLEPAPDPLLAEGRRRAVALLGGDVDAFLGWEAVFGTDLVAARPLRSALSSACRALEWGGLDEAVTRLHAPR